MLKKCSVNILMLAAATLLNFVYLDVTYAEKRIALVIGNSEYTETNPLPNPVNDANLMAKTLEEAGFEVTKLLNADLRSMRLAVRNFGRALRKKTEAGLFYYAGHGIQVNGENFLIPVNASITDEDEIELEGIKLNSFLRVMNRSSANVNIVVLDACRNNPFARSFRSAGRGLAPVDAPKGTYIAYSTAPGDVAADGAGKNSPYTKALAAAMSIRGIAIEKVFKNARKSVLLETNNLQVPWETTSITGDFYFHNSEPAKTSTNNSAPSQISDAEKFYGQIKNSTSINVLKTFVERFPTSFYATLIAARVSELERKMDELAAIKQKATSNPGESNRFAKLREAEQIWNQLKLSNDESALNDFIDKFGDTAFASLAMARLDRLARDSNASELASTQWSAISNSQNVTILHKFIEKFPNSSYAQLASERLKNLDVANGLNAKAQWQRLATSQNEELLRDFIKSFPTSKYSKLAANQLNFLQNNKTGNDILNNSKNVAKLQWAKLSRSKNIDALRYFSTRYSDTSYATLANKRIVTLLPSGISSRDSMAKKRWIPLSLGKDISALRRFASEYSDTKYAAFANKRIVLFLPSIISNRESVAKKRWIPLSLGSDIGALQSFSSEFSKTKYATLANQRIRKLRLAKPIRSIKKVGTKEQANIGRSGQWYVYHRDIENGKNCNAQSYPTTKKQNAVHVVFVSSWIYRSKAGNYNQVSLGILKKRIPVKSMTLEIGDAIFQLTVNNDGAFSSYDAQNAEIIDSMKAKRRMTVRTTTRKGKVFIDKFSLNGVTSTLKKLSKACPKPI